MKRVNRKSQIPNGNWLPDMDFNHDKQIQSLLCYRYTIGQTVVSKLDAPRRESRFVESLNRSIHDLRMTIDAPGSCPPRANQSFNNSTVQQRDASTFQRFNAPTPPRP